MGGLTVRSRIIRATRLVALLLVFSLASTPLVFSDDVYYSYDDTGQLISAVKAGQGVGYRYDANGNLIGTAEGTTSTVSPSIQSVTPSVLFIGTTTNVVISGQSLFSTQSVTSGSSGLTAEIISVTDTQITVAITVPPQASPGTVSLTLTTLWGSASVNVTLSASQMVFIPDPVVLASGQAGTITANVAPPISGSLTTWLTNSAPLVASVPSSVTIPSSGSTTFQVNALALGSAVISSGGARSTVYVAPPFSTLPGEYVTSSSNPVSVSINSQTTEQATVVSVPMTVFIDQSVSNAEVSSVPVSIFINSQPGNSEVASVLVSVKISQ